MAHKLLALRIFDDERGVMNRSVMDVGGEVCIVSQFTLHALTAKGNRPAYIRAAGRDIAVPLYEKFVQAIEQGLSRPVATGIFGANMQVELVNDGPVTILIDTKNKE
jgi:D-tyrosyl-tRNA(Tyr) deacylase